MNPWFGVALALTAFAVGYAGYGWRGLLLAASVTAFWLLLQASRLLRVMRAAAEAPVGRVGSAVMLNAKLREGMKLSALLPLTRSLGKRIGAEPEIFEWADAGGIRVEVELQGGKVTRWTLHRPLDSSS
ncbi:hypothetical protein BH11PSE10_BH11PSE10_19750 [soil metagenome]